MFGTPAVDGSVVTFGTARRASADRHQPARFSLSSVRAHPSAISVPTCEAIKQIFIGFFGEIEIKYKILRRCLLYRLHVARNCNSETAVKMVNRSALTSVLFKTCSCLKTVEPF